MFWLSRLGRRRFKHIKHFEHINVVQEYTIMTTDTNTSSNKAIPLLVDFSSDKKLAVIMRS